MKDIRLDVCKNYQNRTLFNRLQLQIDGGEITCVLGASGAGKTTLLNILAGLTDYDGQIDGLPSKLGYAFQEARLLANLTVEQNLLYAGANADEVDALLSKLGILEYKNKRPSQLSGGEKQRVNLARALLSGGELLLLDEPFSSLNIPLKARLVEMLAQFWLKKKCTVVLVTHDLEIAWALGHRIVVLSGGEVTDDLRPKRESFPAKYGVLDEEKQKFLRVLTDEKQV